jgi:hypothetical protein
MHVTQPGLAVPYPYSVVPGVTFEHIRSETAPVADPDASGCRSRRLRLSIQTAPVTDPDRCVCRARPVPLPIRTAPVTNW